MRYCSAPRSSKSAKNATPKACTPESRRDRTCSRGGKPRAKTTSTTQERASGSPSEPGKGGPSSLATAGRPTPTPGSRRWSSGTIRLPHDILLDFIGGRDRRRAIASAGGASYRLPGGGRDPNLPDASHLNLLDSPPDAPVRAPWGPLGGRDQRVKHRASGPLRSGGEESYFSGSCPQLSRLYLHRLSSTSPSGLCAWCRWT